MESRFHPLRRGRHEEIKTVLYNAVEEMRRPALSLGALKTCQKYVNIDMMMFWEVLFVISAMQTMEGTEEEVEKIWRRRRRRCK
jgi:hypothetical protein